MKSSAKTTFVAALALLAWGTLAQAQEGGAICGNPWVNPFGWGPFDYLDPLEHANPQHIPMLEKHHFNSNVQMGGHRGQNGHILNDLKFILRACPNHHRALNVLLKYHIKHEPFVAPGESPSCYLDRASRFNPEDGTVHMLAGIYYARSGANNKALDAYKTGLNYMPDSPDLHYNIGLLYVDLGRLEDANEHAVRAYTLGAQLPGLKRKLVRRDAWNPDVVQPQAAVEPIEEEGL